MKRKMTPEEWAAFKAEAEAGIQELREHVARERAKLEAKHRTHEAPRGRLRRLFAR